MPVPAAVALVSTMTSHATWQQLVGELDGGPDAAPDVAWKALNAALFHQNRLSSASGNNHP